MIEQQTEGASLDKSSCPPHKMAKKVFSPVIENPLPAEIAATSASDVAMSIDATDMKAGPIRAHSSATLHRPVRVTSLTAIAMGSRRPPPSAAELDRMTRPAAKRPAPKSPMVPSQQLDVPHSTLQKLGVPASWTAPPVGAEALPIAGPLNRYMVPGASMSIEPATARIEARLQAKTSTDEQSTALEIIFPGILTMGPGQLNLREMSMAQLGALSAQLSQVMSDAGVCEQEQRIADDLVCQGVPRVVAQDLEQATRDIAKGIDAGCQRFEKVDDESQALLFSEWRLRDGIGKSTLGAAAPSPTHSQGPTLDEPERMQKPDAPEPQVAPIQKPDAPEPMQKPDAEPMHPKVAPLQKPDAPEPHTPHRAAAGVDSLIAELLGEDGPYHSSPPSAHRLEMFDAPFSPQKVGIL